MITMKAQISLELLIVFAIFLVVIMFSLSSLQGITQRNNEFYQKLEMAMIFEDIADASDNVCVLGPGNVRKVKVPTEINISKTGDNITVIGNGQNYSRYIACNIEPTTIQGTIKVQNNAGTIEYVK